MFPVIVPGFGCCSLVVACLRECEYKEAVSFAVFATCSSSMVIKLVMLTDELA